MVAFLGRQNLLAKISGFVLEEVKAPVVIQEVHHDQPPVTIDESLVALHLEHKVADNVMALSAQHAAEHRDADPNNQQGTDRIYLLEFNRHPEAFRKALCEGPPLQQCRTALEQAGCKWLLGSGAKVFVHPHQYAQALVDICERGIDLRPFHVIVAESFQYHVEASLADVPCRQGARVKRHHVLHEVATEVSTAEDAGVQASAESHFDAQGREEADEDEDIAVVISRTFLCVARRLRNPESVTQSTTEVHSQALNPRRVCLSD